jgi:hypothetical protein
MAKFNSLTAACGASAAVRVCQLRVQLAQASRFHEQLITENFRLFFCRRQLRAMWRSRAWPA